MAGILLRALAFLPLAAHGKAPATVLSGGVHTASASATVTQSVYLVDPTFAPDLPGEPPAIAAQADGKVLVTGPLAFSIGGASQYGLARLNVDGSLDTSYVTTPSPFSSSAVSAFEGISVQPDGSSVVDFINGMGAAAYADIAASGTWNPSYSPPPGVPLASGGWAQLSIDLASNTLTVTILNADPSVASSYPVVLAPPPSGASSLFFSSVATAFDSQGRLIVAAAAYVEEGTADFGANTSRIIRLLPDGSLDPSYAMVTVDRVSIEALSPGPGGNTLYCVSEEQGPDGSYTVIFNRLLADGSADGTYSPVVSSDFLGGQYTVSTFGANPDGSFLLTDQSMVNGSTVGVARYDPSGVRDPTFVLQMQSPSFASTQRQPIEQLVALANGQILVLGDFTSLNGTPLSYVARLEPTTLISPAPATVACGSSITLSASSSLPSPGYQWELNGAPIAGATNATLVLDNIGTSQAGIYAAAVTSGTNTLVTQPAAVAVTEGAWLTNLSARAHVAPSLNAADVLIAGFAVAGPSQKTVLIRGSGPGLQQFGVTDFLVSPSLGLYTSTGTQISAATGWSPGLSSLFASVGAFPYAAGSHDTALVNTFGPGSYTAIVNSTDSGDGVALAELYDADREAPTTRIINLSARAYVGTGANILIGGFAIVGSSSETVLIRAVGPGLGSFGLTTGILARPLLQVYDTNPNNSGGSAKLIASVEGWAVSPAAGSSSVPAGIQPATAATMAAAGAFGLPSGGADSALVLTLPPGAYTAEVSGSDGGSGVALVEIYEVP